MSIRDPWLRKYVQLFRRGTPRTLVDHVAWYSLREFEQIEESIKLRRRGLCGRFISDTLPQLLQSLPGH